MRRKNTILLGIFLAAVVFLSMVATPAIGEDNFIKLSDELSIYSGDVINLIADNGTYVKRYYRLKGHSALMCYQTKPDDASYFTVEVIGPRKIRLIANNGYYCKRFYQWRKMSFITMDKPVPDKTSVFDVSPKGKNKITLRANNGQFLKRFYASNIKKSVITAYRNVEDPCSIFTVKRARIGCKEKVEHIAFDLNELHKSVTPYVLASQNLTNDSSVEQMMEFKVSQTVETSKVFEWSRSFQIGTDTSFGAKIPLIGNSNTTIRVQTKFTKGGSKSSKDSQTFEATFPIKCPPNTTIRATASIQKGRVDVPYTATISRIVVTGGGKEYQYTYKVRGIFSGVNAFALRNSIKTVRGTQGR